MKHVYLLGQKQYAFCAIDLFSSPSSLNARSALKKAVERFGAGIKIVNDNDNGNMAEVWATVCLSAITGRTSKCWPSWNASAG